jgi:hypothetical protein
MENLKQALNEMLGLKIKTRKAQKCFISVYSFLLYQDTPALIKTLEYRSSLAQEDKAREKYFIFRYMLRLLKERHPGKLNALCSNNAYAISI